MVLRGRARTGHVLRQGGVERVCAWSTGAAVDLMPPALALPPPCRAAFWPMEEPAQPLQRCGAAEAAERGGGARQLVQVAQQPQPCTQPRALHRRRRGRRGRGGRRRGVGVAARRQMQRGCDLRVKQTDPLGSTTSRGTTPRRTSLRSSSLRATSPLRRGGGRCAVRVGWLGVGAEHVEGSVAHGGRAAYWSRQPAAAWRTEAAPVAARRTKEEASAPTLGRPPHAPLPCR